MRLAPQGSEAAPGGRKKAPFVEATCRVWCVSLPLLTHLDPLGKDEMVMIVEQVCPVFEAGHKPACPRVQPDSGAWMLRQTEEGRRPHVLRLQGKASFSPRAATPALGLWLCSVLCLTEARGVHQGGLYLRSVGASHRGVSATAQAHRLSFLGLHLPNATQCQRKLS